MRYHGPVKQSDPLTANHLLFYMPKQRKILHAADLYERQLLIYKPYFKLFLIIFFTAIVSKGAVIFRAYSIDDYSAISLADSTLIDTLTSQGRYIAATIIRVIDAAGVNLNDVYFAAGIFCLLLESVFAIAVLRFVGLASVPSAGLAGGIMVAHPYLTEVFTFRLLLPLYCFVLLFSTVTLEAITQGLTNWRSRVLALSGAILMVFTYQSFLNYFAVVIAVLLIHTQLNAKQKSAEDVTYSTYQWRVVNLVFISVIAVFLYFVVTITVTHLGLFWMTPRTSLLEMGKIGERFRQSGMLLAQIYWKDEPLLQGWSKTLVSVTLLISSATIFIRILLRGLNKSVNFSATSLAILAFIGLIPISIGLILPFTDWWPVPRVIAHIGAVTSLLFLLAAVQPVGIFRRTFNVLLLSSQGIIWLVFILLSNQILADQQRINEWDKMTASRIISRLEVQPGFEQVRIIHVNGGAWAYPSKFRMIQGDMNVSSFSVDYSKIPLLTEVSGYKFGTASGDALDIGKDYCKNKHVWPHPESTAIKGALAIVCLRTNGAP